MIVVLDYWNRRWQSVAFDCTLGVGRVRWFAPKPAQCAGWAYRFENCWFALRIAQGEIVFQAGAKVWPLTDGLRCESRRHGTYRIFSLKGGDHVAFHLDYPVLTELDGPTADSLDVETKDFFYWVALVWNSPRQIATLKKSWSQS
jgi:hypothetical protein